MAFPVAACLVALALAFGLMANPFGKAGVLPDFTVRAYAEEANTPLEMGVDSKIVFGRSVNALDSDNKETYLETGCYTGCMFRVEGEGITRLQANISNGALYRFTTEQVAGDDTTRLSELASWKPQARGTGEYYGDYDYVTGLPGNTKDGVGDPEGVFNVGLYKKLGQTVDIAIGEATPLDSFSLGFWTNVDYGDVPDEAGPYAVSDAIIDTLDGATLTITVTFEDGHTTTQTITLHAGDVRGSIMHYDEETWTVSLTSEFVDAESEALTEGVDYVHTLYGTVESTTNEAFPFPTDNANEFESIVDAAPAFERQSVLRQAYKPGSDGGDAITKSDLAMASANTSVDLSLGEGISASVSNVRIAYCGEALSENMTLADLDSGFGNNAYMNRVTSQINGYALDENSTPYTTDADPDGNTGWKWVMLEADITNTGSEAIDTPARIGMYVGDLAIVDDEGTVQTAFSREFAIVGGSYLIEGAQSDGNLSLAPGETKSVRWMEVVPNLVIDNDTLLMLPNSSAEPSFTT